MKLEDQLILKEQAKKLKSLRVTADAIWYLVYPVNDRIISSLTGVCHKDWANQLMQENDGGEFDLEIAPAYSVAELGELLPDKFQYQMSECFVDSVKFCKEYRWIAGIHTVWAHNKPVVAKKYFPGDNEAKIRADVLIYLLETHHITAEDCNKRLLEA